MGRAVSRTADRLLHREEKAEPRNLICEIKNVIIMDSPGADGFRPEVSDSLQLET